MLWKALAAGCVLASSVVWLSGASAPARIASSSTATTSALQLNLCDSGIAGCFTGRSVSVAAAVIRAERPAIVTLNEACRGDVFALRRAMAATNRGPHVVSAFKAVPDRATGGVVRCRNGERYGVGVTGFGPVLAFAYRTYAGVYPTQDLSDPEERVWLCLDRPGVYLACTTHTASTSPTVALAQCRYFFRSAAPMIGGDPVILGATSISRPAACPTRSPACRPVITASTTARGRTS